jgi:hypothetical protein
MSLFVNIMFYHSEGAKKKKTALVINILALKEDFISYSWKWLVETVQGPCTYPLGTKGFSQR